MTDVTDPTPKACSAEQSFEILGGAWTFLILREALFGGVTQFDGFQSALGIARESLRRVLNRLVRNGVMEQRPLKPGGSRKGYFLTRSGHDLVLCLAAAIKWGQNWGDHDMAPERLTHRPCGHDLVNSIACSACHSAVDPRDVSFKSRIRVRTEGQEKFGRSRYVELSLLERMRPCSIAKTMATIGDPWSFLIIREAFYGVRRFDQFQRRLKIASNILAGRLKRLVTEDVFSQGPVADEPHLMEYRLTEKGFALYDLPLSVIAWGDRWLAGEDGPPLELTHRKCGHSFHAELYCPACDRPVEPDEVHYQVVEPG